MKRGKQKSVTKRILTPCELRIRWPEKISNVELHSRIGISNVSDKNLVWIGHVLRMDNTRICMTGLTWHPEAR